MKPMEASSSLFSFYSGTAREQSSRRHNHCHRKGKEKHNQRKGTLHFSSTHFDYNTADVLITLSTCSPQTMSHGFFTRRSSWMKRRKSFHTSCHLVFE